MGIYIADDGVRFDDFEYQFPKNSEIWDILRYNNLGYDLETIKRCFQILKNYLDEQIRLKRGRGIEIVLDSSINIRSN